jgi:WD40 repeat protein
MCLEEYMAIDNESIKLFFSYSHKDEDIRNELANHLDILKRQRVILTWYDRQIGAGTEWANQIDENLKKADIILLLVSSYFIASDYCYDIELEIAMKRHEAKEALVVPIILRPVDWSGAPFAKLQAFPKDAKAITTWQDKHEAFVNVAQGIRKAITELLEERKQKFKQKEAARMQYLKKLEEALSDGEISIPERHTLTELQQELRLTPEEAREIEKYAFEPLERYKENLNKYRKTLKELIENEYPFSEQTQNDLKLRQRDLGIKIEDVTKIEKPIFEEAELKCQKILQNVQAVIKQEQELEIVKQNQLQKQQEKEEYAQKLQQYEQEFTQIIQHEFPLSRETVERLKQLQEDLILHDVDVHPIRNRIVHQRQAQLSQLKKNELNISVTIQDKNPLIAEKTPNNNLNQTQNNLYAQNLVDGAKSILNNYLTSTSKKISTYIDESFGIDEDKQRKVYQEKLQRYEHEFLRISKIEFPIRDFTRHKLKNIQDSLGIENNDVVLIEKDITAQLRIQKQNDVKQEYIHENKSHHWRCPLTLVGHSERVKSIAINNRETILVSGSDDKKIKIWDIESGNLLQTLEGHSNWITAVSLSADNEILVSGSADKKVIVWNLITGEKQKTLTGHSDWVTAAVISPNRHIIASSSNDKKIQIWHPKTGKLLRTIKDNTEYIRALTTDANGQVLVSSGSDKIIKLWNLSNGALSKSLAGHSSFVRTLALSQDGTILVSGSDDQTIKIWNLSTGELLYTLTGHLKSVLSVAISSNGRILVSGSDDQTIKIWDLSTGELLNTLIGHSAGITSVTVNCAGTLIASGSSDRTIKIWR